MKINMTTNIQDVVAEFDERWPIIETELGDDHPAFIPREVRDWLTTTLTQLVKEVEAGERERFRQILVDLHNKKQSELHGGYDDADFLTAYCFSLQEAMQRLQALTPPTSDEVLKDNK